MTLLGETTMKWEEIINFWFEEIEPVKHWIKDPEFDQLLRTRFGDVHTAATKGELYHWRENPNGRLAEIIVLDQFSRNMFRDKPEAFAYDTIALILAQEAIAAGADKEVNPEHISFMYMPFMHSESAVIHEEAMKLFTALGSLEFEVKHKAIIDRFGRYPHRNAILGRESTAEEIEFMQGPDSSF
ncbi:MAG: hypothetical protein ACI9EW_002726 [Cellvibrionaceae bacterium]|jgi:uncharacterized protein (DUF924 family)